jgi:putative ABC transport system permease protein
MGLQPVVGGGFEEQDFALGPVKVILLGYEFWQRAFNGDPKIIGQTVRISRWDVPPTVIGDAAGSAVSAIAGGGQGAELQC